MSDGGALPQEIITDILSRLPFKSLSRFKCVSLSWKTLISSSQFDQIRLNRTKAILFTSSFNLYSIDFSDENPTPKKLDHPPFNHMSDSRSVSSCNGLVLASVQGFVNFLLNPSTSEWKELPAPFHMYSSIFYPPGLGYVASSDDYKVMMPFFKEGRNTNDAAVMIVAVYSLKNNAWRTIQDFHYRPVTPVERGRGVCFNERLHWPRRRTGGFERGCGVCFNERLHWLCRRAGGFDYFDYSTVVVAINLADEIFRDVQLPASYDDNKFRGHDMVVLEGCLCLLVWLKSDRIDVWMMMEYGVRESWMNFFSISNPGSSIVHVLCLSAQDELVLRRERRVEDEIDGEKLILYNPKQGTQREVVVPGIPTTSLVGDHYIETIDSPNIGRRISETMRSVFR